MTQSLSLRRGQVICFSLLWTAYCSTYLLRKPLGVVKSDLAADLQLDKTQLGWCDTAVVLPYAAVQILLPQLTDSYGPRTILTYCLALAGLTTQLTYTLLSGHLLTLCLGLALTGGLLAPCWPAATASLSSWWPDSKLNSVFGWINTATYSGGLGGTALAAAMLEYHSWHSVAIIPAGISVITAALISQLLASPQEKEILVPGKTLKTTKEPNEDTNNDQQNNSLMSLLQIPSVPQLSLAMFCLKFVRYYMQMWLPLYLLEHLGYSKLQAGLFSTMFDVGGIIGSPLLGTVLDKYYSETPLRGVTLVIGLGCVTTGVFVVTASYGVLVNCVCLMVTGAAICGPDSILAGSVSMNIGGARGGAVTSFINGVGNMGGIVEGPLVGLLWTMVGWEGVLLTVVGVTALATLASYSALKIENSSSVIPK